MAEKHPYVQSPGHLVQVINHLRNSFPATVNAGTLKKLGFAPKNESYVVNTLRFLGLIDEEGAKTDTAGKVFSLHQDDKFHTEFGRGVKTAYQDLFSLHGDKMWQLDLDALITFFRESDQSSSIVGRRQASTFLALSSLAGHSELPQVKGPTAKGETKRKRSRKKKPAATSQGTRPDIGERKLTGESASKSERAFGLTVRIEVNLPASGDQATYDRIFKSIRGNLLDG